jgi:acyl-[acyl carrier protein]--UDP-N-acetylglucosamine O-acyltransferase
MAVNKNFVVKNGLEVDTNTLFVDSANNRVAIGTTVPTASLDVRGKILSDSQVESWVGKFVGIVTAGAVGVTTLTYSVGTGSSTKLGRANAEELNVTAGFTTVQSMSATDIIVSVGSTFSKDVNIGAAATVGAALTVTGGAKIALDSRFEKALEVGEDLNVGAAATITGISTFTGAAKFAANSRFEKSLAIGEDLNVGGATTVGGALTVTGNAYFNGNVDVGGDLTFDEVNARNATITGIATVGFSTSANAYVAGITTSSLLHVGMGATMVKVQGTPATRVGINSVGPAFTLDVDGDINSTGTIRQAGSSVLTTASGDATALAIALG